MKALLLSYLIIGLVTALGMFFDHKPYFRAGMRVGERAAVTGALAVLIILTVLLWPYAFFHDVRVALRRARRTV